MNLIAPSKQIIALTLLNFIIANIVSKLFMYILPIGWEVKITPTYGRIILMALIFNIIGLALANYYVVSKGYIDRKNIFPASIVTIFLLR